MVAAIDAEVVRVLGTATQLPLPLLRAVGRMVAAYARIATLSERCLERFFHVVRVPNGSVDRACCKGGLIEVADCMSVSARQHQRGRWRART